MYGVIHCNLHQHVRKIVEARLIGHHARFFREFAHQGDELDPFQISVALLLGGSLPTRRLGDASVVTEVVDHQMAFHPQKFRELLHRARRRREAVGFPGIELPGQRQGIGRHVVDVGVVPGMGHLGMTLQQFPQNQRVAVGKQRSLLPKAAPSVNSAHRRKRLFRISRTAPDAVQSRWRPALSGAPANPDI